MQTGGCIVLSTANKHTSFSFSVAVHHIDFCLVFKGLSENVLQQISSDEKRWNTWIVYFGLDHQVQMDSADIVWWKVVQKWI